MAIHPAAAQGYSARADIYAKGRPDYAPEVVDWLREDLALGPGKTALDLGSGTGKFLPTLHATGASVIAVEPVDAMRAQLTEQNTGIEAKAGSAEHIPLADASLDAVICAQCFHWFANAEALAEIRRVLKPGGALGLIWNVRDEHVPWVAALTSIVEPYSGGAPRFNRREWRRVFPADGFTPLVERHMYHHHTGSPERVIVDRALSVSFIAALPQAKQDEIAKKLRALIAATLELAGKAEVTFPYRTEAFSCRTVA
jgi:ubiquinone/menaquinone biosynthesis C-methylase UbiE